MSRKPADCTCHFPISLHTTATGHHPGCPVQVAYNRRMRFGPSPVDMGGVPVVAEAVTAIDSPDEPCGIEVYGE